MTAPRDTDRLIRAFLAEGETDLPDQVFDAIRHHIDRTNQRVVIGPWRTPLMSSTVRLIAAATVVVVAALVGYQLLVAPNVGEPAPSETPAPLPTTMPVGEGTLAPGTYSIGSEFPVQFDLTIVDDWEGWGATQRIVRIWKPCDPPVCTGYSDILTFEIVSNVFSDPCRAIPGPSFGNSVDDLVNAITNIPGFQAGPVTDVSVDGYPGKSFALSFIGVADETCVGTGTWQWTSDGPVEWGANTVQRVIVLEVDGPRLVVDAVRYGSDGQEMDTIIDSIRFR